MPILIAVALIVVLLVLGFSVLNVAGSLLMYALMGLIVGAVARLVVPGDQHMGWLATILFGVAGALVGGLIGEAADLGRIVTFVISVITAAVLVALFAGRDSNRGRVLD